MAGVWLSRLPEDYQKTDLWSYLDLIVIYVQQYDACPILMVMKWSSHSFLLTKSSGVQFSFLTVWAASFISQDIIVQ